MRALLFAFALMMLVSCVSPRGSFQVVPHTPNYLLRSPDASDTPFPEVLRNYNGFEPGHGGMDLRPGMELSIENAYYADGMPKRGLNGFLGTEVARYEVRPRGLRLLSVQPMKNRPADQVPFSSSYDRRRSAIATTGSTLKFSSSEHLRPAAPFCSEPIQKINSTGLPTGCLGIRIRFAAVSPPNARSFPRCVPCRSKCRFSSMALLEVFFGAARSRASQNIPGASRCCAFIAGD